MPTSIHWAVRQHIGPTARRRARRVVDAVVARPLGSVRAGRSATRVAITLDDGPDPDVTPPVLDVLDEHGVSCTFFLLVNQCRRWPQLAREIAERGHEVALHGLDHRRITGLPHADAVRYLEDAKQELAAVVGGPVRFYRPPYGAQTVPSYLAARRAGLQVVVWSADADDWVDRPVDQVVARGVEALGPGGILLAHERLEPDPLRGAPRTTFDRPAMVAGFITGCRDRGWSPTTVTRLVEDGGPVLTAWFRP